MKGMQEQLQVNSELICIKGITDVRLNYEVKSEKDSFKIKKLRQNKEVHRQRRKSGKKKSIRHLEQGLEQSFLCFYDFSCSCVLSQDQLRLISCIETIVNSLQAFRV